MNTPPPSPIALDLPDLGWRQTFLRQLDADCLATQSPARVLAVFRNSLRVAGSGFETTIPPLPGPDDLDRATVGDWLMLDKDHRHALRLLDRFSLFKRRAPGEDRRFQLIAANVDTVFVVTSCNADFNVARLERYLALAHEAGAVPVIVLTKPDTADDPDGFRQQALRLMPGLSVEMLDARDPDQTRPLQAWCGRGQTVAFLGSSGVGKSTLINTLMGSAEIGTRGIREQDSKGRHTTTHREMHHLASGGWLVDTPGMRELQLADTQSGIDEVFSDIADLARSCRFSDCNHDTEPGCAIRAAVASGEISEDRVARWQKLVAEEAFNSATLSERRAADRAFGKMVRNTVRSKNARRY